MASRPAPMTSMVSARRAGAQAGSRTWLDRQGPHRTRRGRSGRVVPSGPRTFRGRAYPHGRSEPPQPAQRSPPLVASRSAWASSRTTITASGSPHVDDSARSHRHGPGAVRVAPCPTAPGRNNLGDTAPTIDSDPLQGQVNKLSHTATSCGRAAGQGCGQVGGVQREGQGEGVGVHHPAPVQGVVAQGEGGGPAGQVPPGRGVGVQQRGRRGGADLGDRVGQCGGGGGVDALVAVLLATPLPPDERAALDAAIATTYARAGITTDPATWTRPAPLLADVRTTLGQARTTA
jgi:hypothetical protein